MTARISYDGSAVPVPSPLPGEGRTVLVAMSGGVDSSIAAALLAEAGWDVIGVTLKLWCYGESDDAARLREVVERIAHEIGVQCTVEIEESEDEIRAVCDGHDLGMLIGRHGQTIDAIQYLANAILFRGRYEERKPVIVDAAGYRDRRQATLDALALRMAEQASATGQRVELEPMTSVERKIVHEKLKDDPEVETASEGNEPNRFVVIFPRHVDV